MNSEANAFQLFPPVWGCRFDVRFQAVLDARTTLGEQPAEIPGPSGPCWGAVALQVKRSLKQLEATLRGGEPTAGRPLGVPVSVTRAVARLATRAGGVETPAADSSADVEAKLPALDVALEQLLATRFPPVLGIRYVDLVDRLLAENSAVALRLRPRRARTSQCAIAALARVRQHEQTIASERRKQAARAAKAEKAA